MATDHAQASDATTTAKAATMNDGKAADDSWDRLGLGVRFMWSNVAYEVTKCPDGDVCQIRRIGKAGKLWGPVRRFTREHCTIELPQILKGKE